MSGAVLRVLTSYFAPAHTGSFTRIILLMLHRKLLLLLYRRALLFCCCSAADGLHTAADNCYWSTDVGHMLDSYSYYSYTTFRLLLFDYCWPNYY